ncbi:MAG: VOC family protein [Actinomycetota bacterium]|nr:VOC family protein [Actinomycetota bacterium]
MQHSLEIAYLGLEVPEPESLSAFFAEVIGLVPGEPAADGALTWRNDGAAQRVLVQPGAANDAVLVGLEATDLAAHAAAVERLGGAGFAVVAGSAEECGARRVEALARTTAPWGMTVEVVAGLERGATPYASPLVPGGFLTAGLGFGHVAIATMAYDESQRFLVEGMGFGRSDWLQMPMGPDFELDVSFFHCNGRHHTFAFVNAPFEFPQRLHHVMFEVNERDDVGAAFDRAWASGLPIPNGLGRHDNDHMFSFYVQSPAGFQVEVGHGARTVTDDWADDRRYDRISAWGHQPLRQG